MTKRVIALLIAVIFPITLLFAGCATAPDIEITPVKFTPEGTQLSVAEYRDALKDTYLNYVVALWEVPLDEEHFTSENMKSDLEQVRESCRKCREALNKFGTMNPPEQYREKHIKLLDGVNNGLEYIAALEGFLTARNNAELNKYSDKLDEITERPEEQTLSGIYTELFKEVNEAAGPDTESA